MKTTSSHLPSLNPQNLHEPLVYAKTIGNLLSLNERSVYNHFHSGKIPGYRIGKSIRFKISEVYTALGITAQ